MITGNIETNKIRQDMMKLWKETFHDSDSYINLVFDTYFSQDNAFVRYDGEKLSAALLCIPYEFKVNSNSIDKSLSGMYLCGLATRPEFRRQGIMTELMNEAEASISERGYDMTFLIPADDPLREFYKRRGYYYASYKTISTYISNPDNRSTKLHIYTISDLIKHGKSDFIRDIAGWCRNIEEQESTDPRLLHSERDMLTVISENENSIFVCDEPIDLKYPILANLVSVAFPEINRENNDDLHVRIIGLYINHDHFHYKSSIRGKELEELAEEICRFYNISKIEFALSDKIKLGRIIGENSYAMIKPIRNVHFFSACKKPVFEICLLLD